MELLLSARYSFDIGESKKAVGRFFSSQGAGKEKRKVTNVRLGIDGPLIQRKRKRNSRMLWGEYKKGIQSVKWNQIGISGMQKGV